MKPYIRASLHPSRSQTVPQFIAKFDKSADILWWWLNIIPHTHPNPPDWFTIGIFTSLALKMENILWQPSLVKNIENILNEGLVTFKYHVRWQLHVPIISSFLRKYSWQF
jgi:hypothetical protein